MKLLNVFISGMILILLITWNSCRYNDSNVKPEELQLNLRWSKGYPGETKENIITGLAWTFSFLGAELPKGSLETAIQWSDSMNIFVDIKKLGFNQNAEVAFRNLIAVIKNSQEYIIFDGIDIGRFVMLTLTNTNHYYAITGAKKTYQRFKAGYNFDQKKAAILTSTIAFGNRLIEISEGNKFTEFAFIAMEGKGSIPDSTFKIKEFEVMDFMKNGQLRFALYDSTGKLKIAASPELTAAGKPTKCLWCHETSLIPPFNDDHTLTGYYSTVEFKNKLDERMSLIQVHRSSLNSDVDFSKKQDHTKAELLYLSFMEPSAERLAAEWNMTIVEVNEKLKEIPTHPHHEFLYLGSKLYFRKDVEKFTPYESIQVPEDPRNYSANERDFTEP